MDPATASQSATVDHIKSPSPRSSEMPINNSNMAIDQLDLQKLTYPTLLVAKPKRCFLTITKQFVLPTSWIPQLDALNPSITFSQEQYCRTWVYAVTRNIKDLHRMKRDGFHKHINGVLTSVL